MISIINKELHSRTYLIKTYRKQRKFEDSCMVTDLEIYLNKGKKDIEIYLNKGKKKKKIII
jgi:tmRNA-binding protein